MLTDPWYTEIANTHETYFFRADQIGPVNLYSTIFFDSSDITPNISLLYTHILVILYLSAIVFYTRRAICCYCPSSSFSTVRFLPIYVSHTAELSHSIARPNSLTHATQLNQPPPARTIKHTLQPKKYIYIFNLPNFFFNLNYVTL